MGMSPTRELRRAHRRRAGRPGASLRRPLADVRGEGPRGSAALRRILVLTDALAVVVAWTITLMVARRLGPGDQPWTVLPSALGLGALSLALVASQRLYWARTCCVRAAETARLARACAFGALALLALRDQIGVGVSMREIAAGSTIAFASLRASRDGYRAWLGARRRRGRHSRPVVVVGTNEEARSLCALLAGHPELGFRACGMTGPADETAARQSAGPGDHDEVRRLGDFDDTVAAARSHGASGVLVAVSALPSSELNRMIRHLLGSGLHVHLSSGLWGIDPRRVRSHPLAHEPFFYLEPLDPRRWRRAPRRPSVIDPDPVRP